MKTLTVTVLTLALLAPAPALLAAGKDAKETPGKTKQEAKADEKRKAIDDIAAKTLDRMTTASGIAKSELDKAVGYAVFDNTKVAIGISGGGGRGVAVDKATGARTYMKMGTVGVGFGLGGQSYQVVFLFETKDALTSFIEKGWQADAQATAAAGTEGANAESTFKNGVAVYQFTEAGLMANADISGTKYWKNEKLD